jgi:hypothetical protein
MVRANNITNTDKGMSEIRGDGFFMFLLLIVLILEGKDIQNLKTNEKKE